MQVTADQYLGYQSDPAVGWWGRPGCRYRLARHGEFEVEVAMDPAGTRNAADPHGDDRRPLAVVAGDSFAFGFGVEVAERWSDLLAARHPGHRFWNIATCGFGTDQIALALETKVCQVPDLVIVHHTPTTEERNLKYSHLRYLKPRFRQAAAGLQLERGHLDWYRRLPRKAKRVMECYYEGICLDELAAAGTVDRLAPFFDRTITAENPYLRRTYRLTEALFARIREQCARWNARLLVVLGTMDRQYAAPGLYLDTGEFDLRLPNRRIGELLNRLRIPCVDLYPRIIREREQVKHFARDGHWTALGHRICADAVDELLAAGDRSLPRMGDLNA